MLIDCIDAFPPYCSLFIIHNDHRASYEKIEDYVLQDHIRGDISPEQIKLCVESDSIWEVQLYPITPIGSFRTCASTLQEAIRLMMLNYKDGRWS
jgi:hypothetical protein